MFDKLLNQKSLDQMEKELNQFFNKENDTEELAEISDLLAKNLTDKELANVEDNASFE